MRLTFLGAAGEVTGSQHLIETDQLRLLLDCGLFQGPRAASRRKNESFRCEPRTLDAVILSHAHIDHCGNLPGLYRAGFRGPVFCTEATASVARLMLLDSAKIQAEDARYLARKLDPGHPPVEPLYTEDDVRGLLKLFEPAPYDEWEVGDALKLRFRDAGHILGSAICELELLDAGVWRGLVFTGDLGRRDMPLLHDPTPVESCDVLITESTYGGRVHPPTKDMKDELLAILRRVEDDGGKIVIPAFSLGRTQQIVYFLNELFNEGELPPLPVFVDSPLATRLTDVFRRYHDILDDDVQETLESDADPFGFHTLSYTRSREESIALNQTPGPFVVISASGMCEGGRVVHHLRRTISDERNAVLLLGYQAPHTLGRHIADREPFVRIFDRRVPLNCQVHQMSGLSAHADAADFAWWFGELAASGGARNAFIVHGEPDSAASLADILRDACDEDPVVPQLYDTFEV